MNDVYKCPICNSLDYECQMCDDEYQCQECEIIEKEMNDAFKYAN